MVTQTHTNTHTHIYIYIYIYIVSFEEYHQLFILTHNLIVPVDMKYAINTYQACLLVD